MTRRRAKLDERRQEWQVNQEEYDARQRRGKESQQDVEQERKLNEYARLIKDVLENRGE